VKAFVIRIQKSGVWWAFDKAVFPISASYAISHFTNFAELICSSSEVGTVIYMVFHDFRA